MLDKLTTVIIIFVALFTAIILYLDPRRVNVAEDVTTNSEPSRVKAPEIASLLSPLESKLKQNPNDANGWALLARSYVEIGRHNESFDSFEKAISLLPGNPQLLADYADAILMVNDPSLNDKVKDLIQEILQLDPNSKKGQLLAASISPTKPLQKPIKDDGSIAEISGVIRLAGGLASKVSANDTLFVFAKGMDGPPMPLAAIKTSVSKLPYIYHLNDTHALNPSMKLSSANQVTIVARISKDGDPIAKPGDLQGTIGPIAVGDVLQDIEINEVIAF